MILTKLNISLPSSKIFLIQDSSQYKPYQKEISKQVELPVLGFINH